MIHYWVHNKCKQIPAITNPPLYNFRNSNVWITKKGRPWKHLFSLGKTFRFDPAKHRPTRQNGSRIVRRNYTRRKKPMRLSVAQWWHHLTWRELAFCCKKWLLYNAIVRQINAVVLTSNWNTYPIDWQKTPRLFTFLAVSILQFHFRLFINEK